MEASLALTTETMTTIFSGKSLLTISHKLNIRRLSCLAHDNQIYLAAQLATRTPGGVTTFLCQLSPGCDHCGEDHGGGCFFNTLVVFDSGGFLVGVYHKYNLWTSELNTFDIDPSGPQLVTVDTPFGRLGLSVCADLIWRSPVVDLVELEEVDTLLVPLYWWCPSLSK